MSTNFWVLSIISTIAILSIYQIVNAQSDDFRSYTSDELGFTIEHPTEWKVEEYPKDNPTEVYFKIRENKDVMNNDLLPESIYDSDFTISVEEPKSDLDTETMTIVNETLEERIQEELDKYSSVSESKLIRQNHVTIGGNDGYKIESRNIARDLNLDRYNLEILINANGKFYVLRYTEIPLKVPETLPLANKMVESFQLIR